MPSGAPEPQDAGPRAAGRRPRTRWLAAALVAAVAVAAAATVLFVLPAVGSVAPVGGRTIVVDIPRGTAARIAHGERVSVIPQRLVAVAGDTLRVRNRDTRDHVIGPFMVTAGQTMDAALASPGTYVGECSVHRSRRMSIVVRP